MKNHLKAITAPKTWLIDRKNNVFVVRPNSGAHSLNLGLPLGLILRNYLALAQTMGEAKRLLHDNEILVDGQRRVDHRFIVGLGDTISIPVLSKYYQLKLDSQGRLQISLTDREQNKYKICKVVGKNLVRKGLLQFRLHDGRNIIADNSLHIGDSVKLEVPSFKIVSVLPLKTGARIMLILGKHSGLTGELKKIEEGKAICKVGDEEITTAKNYLFVVN